MNSVPRVTLKPGKAKPFWCGHPLVFSGAVQSVDAGITTGTIVAVIDAHGTRLGLGVFNAHSQYRVRILSRAAAGECAATIEAFVTRHLRNARALRQLLQLPSAATNAYRVLNSEGDGCSGLTIDLYGDTAVVASSAYWTEQNQAVITRVIQTELQLARVLWRPVPRPLEQDGWKAGAASVPRSATAAPDADAHIADAECGSCLESDQWRDKQSVDAPASATENRKPQTENFTGEAPVQVRENGLQFTVDLHGQKTGFYCDQRDNRAWLETLARGRTVLDAYCFTGGFALYAARGGAARVVGVDSSAPAIALARKNAAANHVGIELYCADVLEYLNAARNFDMIILDPPKLAGTAEHVTRALRYYRHLCGLALRALRPPGMLVVCSCSAALGFEALQHVIRETAVEEQRTAQIVRVSGAAPDHPVLPAFPEGQYLTCLWIAVS
ncbi:MAG: class I SAM-dependent rRNA methyltransferase [bacterium]|nr:class I SAM-dependent rRNA methyltransferase [bacterium]